MITLPYMIIKFVAKRYGINITPSIFAFFAIKLGITTGIYLLYKKKTTTQSILMKIARNFAEFGLIFGII